jgi:hypothetical protein
MQSFNMAHLETKPSHVMLIVEAVRRSNTTHEVCFLLTNYIETLQFYDSEKHLPAGVAHLPLIGVDDIEARHTALREALLCGLARSQCNTNGTILNEATEVFYEALCRLKTLLREASPAVRREGERAHQAAL